MRFDLDNAQRDTTLPASVRFALTLPKCICLIPGLAHRALLRFPRQVVGLVICMSVAAGTASTLFFGVSQNSKLDRGLNVKATTRTCLSMVCDLSHNQLSHWFATKYCQCCVNTTQWYT
ncbi:uncharacterized protein CYBJADRAFT_77135 [Cyberlindnera jadinii NRRL Y-1542]|uniref:Uncharacterized protein n=1 Tax=Cyberlindnera jadinii (strain ATCC 18201 / CBS 1600 / BCRC 20928 / JCM 3617 / NBRC 0987 / NRRL Y-1542) TaxID=983966 RepID=A0A1E4S2T9_CYBJN|nr:hypothetical protein CYBJADRAFT_77135 [Cyberlindnera jadinii NRRL Y-1542]ODV73811.1 hypothetical protein CYBJADRAFT_77135 [Cyberlindnera jadinii NRRL Y-1542]